MDLLRRVGVGLVGQAGGSAPVGIIKRRGAISFVGSRMTNEIWRRVDRYEILTERRQEGCRYEDEGYDRCGPTGFDNMRTLWF